MEGAWDAAAIHHRCATPNPGRPVTKKHVLKTIAALFKGWAATKRVELTMFEAERRIQSLSLNISAKVFEKTSTENIYVSFFYE